MPCVEGRRLAGACIETHSNKSSMQLLRQLSFCAAGEHALASAREQQQLGWFLEPCGCCGGQGLCGWCA